MKTNVSKNRWKKTKPSKQLSKKQAAKAEAIFKKAPHSIVFNRGKVGKYVRRLIKDMRLVMEPYTASKLQMRKKNVLKDLVSVSGMLNISHFLSFTMSNLSVNLHLGKVPRGPTLTFRVIDYCLMEDVLSYVKKPTLYQGTYTTHPLLVMNNFTGTDLHMKLMTSMFQNMFPSINVDSVKLSTIRRCVLLTYNSDSDTIDFRHYIIRVVPSGMSRAVRKLIKPKIPDLGRYNDIADYIDQGGNLSESEAENDGEHNQVLLPQNMSTKGNVRGSKSAIRLIEVGPRMTLKLHKIQEGFWAGGVLYNAVVSKTPTDLKDIEKGRTNKITQRNERTRVQKENVKRKVEEKRVHKEHSLEGMRRKWGQTDDGGVAERENEEKGETTGKMMEDEDDDRQYYMDEVGLPPDKDLLLSGPKRKTTDTRDSSGVGVKRLKTQQSSETQQKPRLSKLAKQRNKEPRDERQSRERNRQDTRRGRGAKHSFGSRREERKGTYVIKGKRSSTRK